MRQILKTLGTACDWIDEIFGATPEITGNEPYFDSHAYLAQVRAKIQTYYY
jgi:hypothetical protein